MKRYIYMILCLVAAVSCELLPDEVKIYGVGCRENEVSLGNAAGEYALQVYADGDFSASLADDALWVRFSDYPDMRSISGNGDMVLDLEYDINRGIPRTAVLTLTRGTNVFELNLSQDGILEGGIDIEQKNISLSAEGGQTGVKVITKLRAEDLSFDVEYKEDETVDWLSGLALRNNFICFDVKTNLTDVIRHAVITVRHSGGTGYIHVTQFYDGCDMTEVEIGEIKGLLAEAGEYVFDSHMILKGVVINAHDERNGAENRIISADNIDLTYSERILYVQSDDGSHGIKLVFTGSCTDVAGRFDRISLDTYGLKLRREDDPVRYYIDRIPTEAVVGTLAGDAPVEKVRRLGELTDDDLFTLVTVPELEIPVRKGNFAPIDIRYINVMVSYPMVIRDRNGDIGHMMVNVDCPWSRDGKELPEGCGSVTAVVVHEKCDNFEWDMDKETELIAAGQNRTYITGLGTIGDYQLRPVTRSEIRIAEDASEGFSDLMYEWAYCDSLGVNLVQNYSAPVLYPTYPLVENPLAVDAMFYCMDKDEKVPLRLCNDFTHLGPYVYGGEITEPSNGNGIYDFLGRSAHWYVYPSTKTIGVLYSKYVKTADNEWDISNGSAWCYGGQVQM